jgi:hypothetical protein
VAQAQGALAGRQVGVGGPVEAQDVAQHAQEGGLQQRLRWAKTVSRLVPAHSKLPSSIDTPKDMSVA